MTLSALIFVTSSSSSIGKLGQILYLGCNERSLPLALLFFHIDSNKSCLALNKFPALFLLSSSMKEWFS